MRRAIFALLLAGAPLSLVHGWEAQVEESQEGHEEEKEECKDEE